MDPVRAAGASIMVPAKKGGVKGMGNGVEKTDISSDKTEISSEAKSHLESLGGVGASEDVHMAEHLADVKRRLESGAYDSGMVTDYIARALLARGDV